MAVKFELFKQADGKFLFCLTAADGEIIASSEGYKSKAGAENGIQSEQTNAPGATVVDKTEPTVPPHPQEEPTITQERIKRLNKLAPPRVQPKREPRDPSSPES